MFPGKGREGTFGITLSYTVKFLIKASIKKENPAVVVHAFNPRTWETEAGVSL